jgi:predicted glycosyltransferase
MKATSVSAPTQPRLLVYSQDGLGLGHLRRTTLLATEFLAASPGATALTISDSPLGRFFSTDSGHDYLKLPSIKKAGPGDWRPVSLSLSFSETLRLRRDVIRSVVTSFEPDVLLVDHMPHGAMGELVPALEAIESSPVRVVLGLRDILDAPATVRQRWRLEGAFEAVDRYYHDVLVYGSQDVFDVAQEYDWPTTASSKLRYCGYVCSPRAPSAPADQIRAKYLGNPERGELVVAMAGGGADGDALFATLLEAVPSVLKRRPCEFVIVTGPFLPAGQRRELLQLASDLPVHVITSVDDSLALLGAADLVVAMAGYNTTAEIVSLGRRALLVPRAGPSAEQRMRASAFAERGWISWLPPESLSVSTLAGALLDQLQSASRSIQGDGPDMGGRSAAVQHLLATRLAAPATPTGSDDSATTGEGEDSRMTGEAVMSPAAVRASATAIVSQEDLVIGQ